MKKAFVLYWDGSRMDLTLVFFLVGLMIHAFTPKDPRPLTIIYAKEDEIPPHSFER